MKRINLFIMMITFWIFLASCSNTTGSATPANETLVQIQNPYSPQDSDADMNKEQAYVESVSWNEETETLTISGNLPTPCNQPRVAVSLEAKQINLEVYSLSAKDNVCAQVLEPFEINLVLKNYEVEKYPIFVNGEKIEL